MSFEGKQQNEAFRKVNNELERLRAENERLKFENRELIERESELTAKLEQVQREYRAIFDHSTDGISVFERRPGTLDRKLVACNASYARMAGRPMEELLDMGDVRPLQRYDLSEDDFWEVQKMIEAGQPYEGTVSWVRPDGRDNYMEYRAVPVRMDDRILVYSIDRDVTRQRLAEDALRESQERFALFMRHLPAASFIKDGDGRVLYANDQYMGQLGLDSDRVIGRKNSELYRERLARQFDDEDGHVLETGQVLETMTQVNRGGVERHYFVIKFPIIRDGRPTLIGGMTIDVTRQVQIQTALNRALEEKNVLLQEIHHRTKNNMQVISSLLRLQSYNVGDDRLKRAFDDAQNRIMAMALVHETLYRSGSLTEIELGDYITQLTKVLQSACLAQEKKVDLKLMLDDQLIPLKIDHAVPCGLALNELISNAAEHAFADCDSGCITVSAQKSDSGEVELRVADDGRGMPEGLDWKNGSTLGLALVSGWVESQLGGRLTYENNPGASFTIRFRPAGYPERI